MKKAIYITLIGLLFATTACEKAFMEGNPETDNKAIFTEYVKLVKEKYAMLEIKDVDIVQLETSIGATIDDNTTETELLEKLGKITLALKDGHSSLEIDAEREVSYEFLEGYPEGFDLNIIADNYISTTVNSSIEIMYEEGSEESDESMVAVYGTLIQDTEIAYIWIPSWNVSITDSQIETIFSSFATAKGLIIDIRQNTGGNPSLATKFASYLMTGADVYTGFERFKTGPGRDDFTDSQSYIKPASSNYNFTKPVIVLTDRYCYSASTTFLYSVNPLEHVRTVGQRSGGGSGSVADGYLANGWKWSLSTSEFIDHLGNHLDNGIEPDIAVALDLNITAIDEVLERAILELQ